MSDIRFKCPACNQSLKAPPTLAGQLLGCPKCKKQIKIPPIPAPNASGPSARQETQSPTIDRPQHRTGGPKQTTPPPASSSAQASKKGPTRRRIRAIILTVVCLCLPPGILYSISVNSAEKVRDGRAQLAALIMIFLTVLFYAIYRRYTKSKKRKMTDYAPEKSSSSGTVLGIIFIGVGVIFLLSSLSMDVSVSTGLGNRVVNVGLMNDRQNYIIISLAILVIGVVVAATSRLRQPAQAIEVHRDSETKKCLYCAEEIKLEAKVCRYCGREQPSKQDA